MQKFVIDGKLVILPPGGSPVGIYTQPSIWGGGGGGGAQDPPLRYGVTILLLRREWGWGSGHPNHPICYWAGCPPGDEQV